MAHSISSKKRIRQNEKRRMRNRADRASLKTAIKSTVDALQHNDAKGAEGKLVALTKDLDRQATRGLIHKNQAARRKSRLARKLNALKKK